MNPNNRLNQLRLRQREITSQILELFILRKENTQDLQSLKKELGLETFDEEVEKTLFKHLLLTHPRLELKEALALSLLIESHSQKDYPQWSNVLGDREKLFSAINPHLANLLDQP